MAVAPAVSMFPLLMMLLMGGGAGLPLSIPPMAEEPILSRIAPADCLFYASFSGMAEPDPKSRNQTEQLLAEPEVRQMAGAIEQAIVRAVMADRRSPDRSKTIKAPRTGKAPSRKAEDAPAPEPPADRGSPGEPGIAGEQGPRPSDASPPVADIVKWAKLAMTRPMAVFVSSVSVGPEGADVQGGAVLNAGSEAPNLKAALEKYQKLIPAQAEQVEIGGMACYRLNFGPGAPPVTWGIKGKTLIVGVGKGAVEGMIKRAAGSPPAWLTALRKQLPVERVSSVMYVNVKKIIEQFVPMGPPPLGAALDALGLNNVTSLASVSGLDGEGFVSRTLVGIEGELAGILRLAAAKPLTAQDLAPIPHDATIAVAARLSADEALATVLKIAGKIEPRAEKDMSQGMASMEDALGIQLRDDLLKPLGDVWCVYNAPSEGGFVITGLTLVVPVKDHARLAATHAKLLAQAKEGLRRDSEAIAKRGPLSPMSRQGVPKIEQFRFAGQEVYFFRAPRFDHLPFAPAWCLTEKELIVAAFPQQIKSYLSRGANFKSLAAAPGVAELFDAKGGPAALTYVDTAGLSRVAYPLLCIGGHALASELQREGIDLSLSALPSFGAMQRHLGPSIGVVRRTEAGIEIVSRGTVPTGGALPVISAVSLMTVRGKVSAVEAEQRRAVMERSRAIKEEKAHEAQPIQQP